MIDITDQMILVTIRIIGCRNPSPSNIFWVISVPAIWTEPAKKFMREAAVKVILTINKLI